MITFSIAGWSSLAARRAHNPKVTGSNPVPATKQFNGLPSGRPFLFLAGVTPGLRATAFGPIDATVLRQRIRAALISGVDT
jgi:hypothetical protein